MIAALWTLPTVAVYAALVAASVTGHAPVVAVWLAVVLWAAARADANAYHRNRCHAKPTRRHRAYVLARRLRTLRLSWVDPDATTPMPALTAGTTA